MAQGSHQFTPTQILEAGRRAEAEGRTEYAIQFYRHLTEHMARSAEAAVARDALLRLGAAPAPVVATPPGAAGTGTIVNGNYFNGMPAPGLTASASQPQLGAQPAGQAAHASIGPAIQGRAQNTSITVPERAPAPGPGAGEGVARRKFVLPRSRRRYRTGRFMARALTFVGFIEIVLGAALLGFGVLARFGIGASALPEIIAAQQQLIGITAGISLIMMGVLVVLGGQLGRAIFDTASANRDLAAFARARAAFEAGQPDEPTPEL